MESDEALYQDIRRGSQAAFEYLYAKYERPVFSFILKRLKNREEAEEVFQETMMSIYRGPEVFHDKGAFAAWLYKVALNLSLNRTRSQRREQAAMLRVVPFERERLVTNSADEDAIEKEIETELGQTKDRIKQSVEDLSPSLREVYRLRSEGKSYEEMAGIVGVPVGTIKSRIHKMMNQLREEVGRWIAK